MQCKKACLVINPRAGANLAKITDVIAVLSAAGWKTHLAIKEYGGHTMELATKAAEDGYDLVIAYGGDGTINQVVNGVMNAKGQHSIVGVIPGGTANVWANEVGIPTDPVKAALTLVNSDARKVDIGHIEVESLTFPDATSANSDIQDQPQSDKQAHTKKVKATPNARHHFLLMAGLGIDAAIMSNVSKPLKYRIGPIVVGLSALKVVPEHHAFPIQIRVADGPRKGETLWKGEALQVVIGNTRKYADIVEMTPNAYIDDGILDICIITAGDPLTTMGQITSLLLRRKTDTTTAEYFHAAHFTISVPASIDLQLDGSAVKLKDYLSKADRQALESASNPEQIMVNYRFDAMPRSLRVAIPRKYDDALFEKESDTKELQAQQQEQAKEMQAQLQTEASPAQHNGSPSQEMQSEIPEPVSALLQHGRKVKVIAASPNPEKKKTYIVAGGSPNSAGDIKPVVVRIDNNAEILKRDGQRLPPAIIQELEEGLEIVVEGKKSKRGVIVAKRVVI